MQQYSFIKILKKLCHHIPQMSSEILHWMSCFWFSYVHLAFRWSIFASVWYIYIILCLFKYHFVPYSSPWWKLLRIWSKCLKILPWFSSSLTIFDLDFLKYTYILVIFGTDVKFNIKFECECFWKVICEIIKIHSDILFAILQWISNQGLPVTQKVKYYQTTMCLWILFPFLWKSL